MEKGCRGVATDRTLGKLTTLWPSPYVKVFGQDTLLSQDGIVCGAEWQCLCRGHSMASARPTGPFKGAWDPPERKL